MKTPEKLGVKTIQSKMKKMKTQKTMNQKKKNKTLLKRKPVQPYVDPTG